MRSAEKALWDLLDQLDHAGIADWEGSEILDLQPAIQAIGWKPSPKPPWGVHRKGSSGRGRGAEK